ncbi:winged helix-turn-helix domain-containing protein [Caulobacter sp. 602-1]|uniref:winged helix-turn-helix domain-containing protein n=1 Tax=Caulobacter sp. 602-1 TaxID=2492472 RepID=UPI001315AB79|nr:winged helix-turn-helix domain-containing protein [Caulobacter sp. 602-1]
MLLRAGEPVEIGARAFDLLSTLLRARGRIVERADLMQAVWPTTIVDESNLRYQIGGLRRILGPDGDRIKNIPGRGYLFADAPPIALALRFATSRDNLVTEPSGAPDEPEADRLRRLEIENHKLKRALLSLVARETSDQAI